MRTSLARDQEYNRQLEEAGLLDTDPHKELYLGIIQQAVKDRIYLLKCEGRKLNPGQQKHVNEILEESHPDEFFDSRWFRDMCRYLRIDHRRVLDRLYGNGDATNPAASPAYNREDGRS